MVDNSIRTAAEIDPDLLLPAWRQLAKGLSEKQRAAAL